MEYFIYRLLLKIFFFLYNIINPPGALPAGFDLATHQVIPTIHEASGIADSKTHPGHLWVQEDGGNPNELTLLSYQGQVKKKFYLPGIKNRDWEDMALVENKIYLADTGDNQQRYTDYSFYLFPEPAAGTDKVTDIQRIRFTYPTSSHDTEAFIVDPQTKNIYLLTKRDSVSLIFLLPFPYRVNGKNQVKLVGKLPYSGVVSAALSPDEKEIIIKTYTNLYSYVRTPAENMLQALQKPYKNLPYQVEPQGEAITFALDGSGYFTLSERRFDLQVNLYFYPRPTKAKQ